MLSEQIEKYTRGLQRYLRVIGFGEKCPKGGFPRHSSYVDRLIELKKQWFLREQYGPFRLEVSKDLAEKFKGPYWLDLDRPGNPQIRARLLEVDGIEEYVIDNSLSDDQMRIYPCEE